MEKIYRGNKFSSMKNKEIDVSKDDLVYRSSNSIIEQASKNINKDDLVYEGVSKDTAYYNLTKIRSAQKKRKLFHPGLELYVLRKYCY